MAREKRKMADRPSCHTCRFLGGAGQFYDCRRHAPIAKNEENRRGGVIEPHWPMVEMHHWCGDHEVAAGVASISTTSSNNVTGG
jgi:hypothetical protein